MEKNTSNNMNTKVFHLIIVNLMLLFINPLFADEYDDNNYRPENSSINIEQSNLPIVFIDTLVKRNVILLQKVLNKLNKFKSLSIARN